MGIKENALLRERIERGHLLRRNRIAPQAIHDDDQDVLRRSGDRRKFLSGALSAADQERKQESSDDLQVLHGWNDTNNDEIVRREGSPICLMPRPQKRSAWRPWRFRLRRLLCFAFCRLQLA